MAARVGPQSCSVVCPNCRQQINTITEPRASNRTHLLALVLCLFVCWCCACALYCTDCARDIEHYCPQCNAYVGVYER